MINFIFLSGKVLWVEKLGSGRKEGTYWRDIAVKSIICFIYNDQCYWIYLLKLNVFLFSGADRDRTDDLLNAIQALSHLSYGPITLLNLKRSLFSTKLYEPDGVDMLLLAG